jgi:RimJ/RimL family protein N-acetyltransferase
MISLDLQINKFNITLNRVRFGDLEMLRNWRNSDFVSKRMVSNEYITNEMQIKWFESINNEYNYFFIAEFNNEKIGVISIKNIENKSAEGGIYLASDKFENTSVVARMVLCFNDFVFDVLKLEYLCSHVKRDNKKAISSTLAQGGIEDCEKSTESYVYFKLTKDSYKIKTKKIREILNKSQ